MSKYKEALDFAHAAQGLDSSNAEVAKMVESIRNELSAGLIIKLKIILICLFPELDVFVFLFLNQLTHVKGCCLLCIASSTRLVFCISGLI